MTGVFVPTNTIIFQPQQYKKKYHKARTMTLIYCQRYLHKNNLRALVERYLTTYIRPRLKVNGQTLISSDTIQNLDWKSETHTNNARYLDKRLRACSNPQTPLLLSYRLFKSTLYLRCVNKESPAGHGLIFIGVYK